MKKSELEYANRMLDNKCQELMKEKDILLGVISNMMKNDEQVTRMFKISTPDLLHIKIDNDWCTITRGVKDATMQEENSEVRESEHQDIEEGRQETEKSCCD